VTERKTPARMAGLLVSPFSAGKPAADYQHKLMNLWFEPRLWHRQSIPVCGSI
jgi:hypothetical protein